MARIPADGTNAWPPSHLRRFPMHELLTALWIGSCALVLRDPTSQAGAARGGASKKEF